jgi:hypothetical protein
VDRVSQLPIHDETILLFYITPVQQNVSMSIELESINREREAHYAWNLPIRK